MSLRSKWEHEQEELRAREKKEEEPRSSRRSSGNYTPLYVLGFVFVLVMAFPLLSSMQPVSTSTFMQQKPSFSQDLNMRATQVAFEQGQLEYGMTQSADLATQRAYEAQQDLQQKQDAINTQIAQATATQAVYATATSFSFTQTPLAAEQIKRQLQIEKMQREAYWAQFVAPLKVLGGALFIAFILFVGVIAAGYAFWRLLPVLEARLRVVKEDRGERTLHIGDRTITRTDLMPEPSLTETDDGTMKPSGGAADPRMQEHIAMLAAQVKAVQSMPQGAFQNKVDEPKPTKPTIAIPDLDVVDAIEIPTKLLTDIRQSLDTESA